MIINNLIYISIFKSFFSSYCCSLQLGCKFQEPGEVTAGSPEPRSLLAGPSEVPTVLGPAAIPTLRKRPLRSQGAQGHASQAQGGCKSQRQVSLSESSALSVGSSVSTCPLMLRPWLGVPRAHMSGRPDTAVTLASQELHRTHLGAPEAASS